MDICFFIFLHNRPFSIILFFTIRCRFLLNYKLIFSSPGYPLTRHTFLNYPNSPESLGLVDQFMLGTDLIMSPVFHPGASTAKVTIPENETWVNIWTNQKLKGNSWKPVSVSAEIGFPAVYCKSTTKVCDDLLQFTQNLEERMGWIKKYLIHPNSIFRSYKSFII